MKRISQVGNTPFGLTLSFSWRPWAEDRKTNYSIETCDPCHTCGPSSNVPSVWLQIAGGRAL